LIYSIQYPRVVILRNTQTHSHTHTHTHTHTHKANLKESRICTISTCQWRQHVCHTPTSPLLEYGVLSPVPLYQYSFIELVLEYQVLVPYYGSPSRYHACVQLYCIMEYQLQYLVPGTGVQWYQVLVQRFHAVIPIHTPATTLLKSINQQPQEPATSFEVLLTLFDTLSGNSLSNKLELLKTKRVDNLISIE
jgi:hypothetical protein